MSPFLHVFSGIRITPSFKNQEYYNDILMIVADGAFKKLKTETGDSGAMSGHTPAHPSSSCPTPARRRHRTTFTQVGLVDVET